MVQQGYETVAPYVAEAIKSAAPLVEAATPAVQVEWQAVEAGR